MHLFLSELFVFCHVKHTIDMVLDGNIIDLSDVLNLLFSLFSVVVKSIWFLVKLQKIKEMLTTLKDLIEFSSFGRGGRNPRLEAYVKRIITVSKFFYGTAFTAVTVAFLMACIFYNERNLQYETWFFWDYKKNFALYWALVAYQYVASVYGSQSNYSYDLVTIVFMSFTSAILDELSAEIETIGVVQRNKNSAGEGTNGSVISVNDSRKLERCVQCHIKIKNFASEISDHLTITIFIQAFFSSVIMCTSAFMLSIVIFEIPDFMLSNF